MIQLQSKIKITDNSGALIGKTIKILKPKNAKIGHIGDLILISSQVQTTNSGIKTGAIFKAIIVRTKKQEHLLSSDLKWDENAAVLVKLSPKGDEFIPIGTRIKSPISASLKFKRGYQKIISLAKTYV